MAMMLHLHFCHVFSLMHLYAQLKLVGLSDSCSTFLKHFMRLGCFDDFGVCGLYGSSRLSASGCMKHNWLNNLEDKAKMYKVRLKSQMRLQRYLAAHRQWKVWTVSALIFYFCHVASTVIMFCGCFFTETLLCGRSS